MFQSKVLQERQLNKNEIQKTTMVTKTNGSIHVKDLKKIIQKIKQKGEQEYNFFDVPLIRVLNGDKWATFKTQEDFENYYEGEVQDTSKFDEIFQIQLTTVYH